MTIHFCKSLSHIWYFLYFTHSLFKNFTYLSFASEYSITTKSVHTWKQKTTNFQASVFADPCSKHIVGFGSKFMKIHENMIMLWALHQFPMSKANIFVLSWAYKSYWLILQLSCYQNIWTSSDDIPYQLIHFLFGMVIASWLGQESVLPANTSSKLPKSKTDRRKKRRFFW